MAKNIRAKKRRKQRGLDAIFSPIDEPKNSRTLAGAATGKRDKAERSMRLAYLQTLLIIFLLFCVVYTYENDPSFRTDFHETLSLYFSPVALLAFGTAGLGLSIAWLIVNYRQDRTRLAKRVGETGEEDLDDLSGL
ncbi:hypothetical protein E6H19_05815 [Candidatus Bathyarchaeota archaeon]|nr:MAG: hypothetical protein E6H30_00120 [Candidatus Bathyarchaeota archaeon]TMI45052.1 MAG: hypothetical protein E6H19_05815 [Candidatus Bathyarchaeota archaeon]